MRSATGSVCGGCGTGATGAGAATTTEIITAWEKGADIVKVYPAHHLGGPDFIRTIRGPIRDVPMLAGGPVPLDEIDSYLDAGCVAVNLGASLALPELVRDEQWRIEEMPDASAAQRAVRECWVTGRRG